MPREHKRHYRWKKHFLSNDHYFWNYTIDNAKYNGIGLKYGKHGLRRRRRSCELKRLPRWQRHSNNLVG